MHHHLTKLVIVSAALLACAPVSATADLSPRLTSPTSSTLVSNEVDPRRGVRRLEVEARIRKRPTNRAWLAMLLGFGLLGALGRRGALPFEEQRAL